MGLNQHIYTLGDYMKQRFGQKVMKLTIDAAFTCPNRDGTLGRGGCTFCNVSSFSLEHGSKKTVAEQLQAGQERRGLGKPYMAYFQAYTSTYDEYAKLKQRYDEALTVANVVGISVGTRPDCVPDEVLDLLVAYQEAGQEVWLELGLQTAHNDTLKKINRGHEFDAYVDTVQRARKRGIKICTHLILGLPTETHAHYEQSLQQVLKTGVDAIKLHPLHIVEGSIMAKQWRADRLNLLSLAQYIDSVVRLIQLTPTDIIFQRVSAYAQKPELLAPDWCSDKWAALNGIEQKLAQSGAQGSALAQSAALYQG